MKNICWMIITMFLAWLAFSLCFGIPFILTATVLIDFFTGENHTPTERIKFSFVLAPAMCFLPIIFNWKDFFEKSDE